MIADRLRIKKRGEEYNYLVVGYNASPYFSLFDFTGGTLTKLDDYNLGALPYGADISHDNKYTAVSANSKLRILQIDGDSLSLKDTKELSSPDGTPSFSYNDTYLSYNCGYDLYLYSHSNGNLTQQDSVSKSPNSTRSSAYGNSSDYIVYSIRNIGVEIYSNSSGTLSFEDVYDPNKLDYYKVEFSPDDSYVAFVSYYSPYFYLLNHSSGSLSLADTYTLPDTGRDVEFSPDGNYIAVGHSSSPYLTLLEYSSGVLSKKDDYILPGTGYRVSWSADSKYLAAGHTTSPYLTLLENNAGVLSKADDYTLSGMVYALACQK